MKKWISLILCIVSFMCSPSYAQEPPTQGVFKELFAGPPVSADHSGWIAKMKQWRIHERDKLNYNDAEYLRPELSWTRNVFMYAQVMAHDRFLYDPVEQKYTVDRFLDDVTQRYGGLDAVLIWPTYPNIGVDNRNQYDLVQSMPGGIEGIKQLIADFNKRGVKVFFPIMIWDHGTRKIRLAMAVALMKEMKLLGADGMNGDTMSGVTEDFRDAYDSLDHPVALQPEWALKDLKMVEWNLLSWGYYWNYQYTPGLSVYKWLEPQHQVTITNRWETNKTNDLQYAFFNGVGYNAWENIWGIWNQIPDRYEEVIRRIRTIYRQFPQIWSSNEWEPYYPTLQKGIFASRFPGINKEVITLINRDSSHVNGQQLQLPFREGMRYFDIWNGTELTPQRKDSTLFLSFPIEGNGYGAILCSRANLVNASFYQFLATMSKAARKSLKSLSDSWEPLPQQIVPIKRTSPATSTPKGMILIPSAKNYVFESNGVMIEGDKLPDAVGVQHPWQQHPSRSQKHIMDIPAFYMDQYPVTNRQFKQFMDATHYHPKDDINFLKDWVNNNFPVGWENKPVTWVSLEDARAYAAWAGKRLPHEWEWQYAAQGRHHNLYPWGNTFNADFIPPVDSGRSMRPPTNVDAFPKGASSFGVMDLVGNVWQWTDEYLDTHTRAAIVKGSGYYRATTSKWYFPPAYELNKYGKYLLMAPCIDRSATIGFRCVKDK